MDVQNATNYEKENQSNCSVISCNKGHQRNPMLIDNESLSNSDNHVFGSTGLDQEITIDSSLFGDSSTNLDNSCTSNLTTVDNSALNIECLTVKKSTEDGVNLDMAVVYTNTVMAENSNNHVTISNFDQVENSLVLAKKTDGIAKDNLNHQTCSSQEKGSVITASTPGPKKRFMKKESKHNISSTSIRDHVVNVLCYKITLVFAICCVSGSFLLPIILYYAIQTRAEVDPEYSHGKNISNAKINLMRICNFSDSEDSDCVDQILYTYEALRTINLPSSQQYCSERVETLFCDALMECSNESYVKDIVCRQVHQEYCTAEWRMLEAHNQTDGLIDCEEYNETAPLTCSDQFDVASDGSVCLPLCGEFSQYSEGHTTPHIIIVAVSELISAIGGLTVLVIAFRKGKKMFHFPQVLVIFNAGILAFINIIIFISAISVGRWNILCSRKFLFDAFDNPSAFCTVDGCLIAFVLVLYSYIWLLYVFHLTLKLVFPMTAYKIFHSDYRRVVSSAEVLVVCFMAAVPSVIGAGLSKYNITTHPPIVCGNDRRYQFFTVAVPILIATCIGLNLMLIVLYKLHKNRGICKRIHVRNCFVQPCICQFTVPEVKIVFVLLYWLLINILVWAHFSVRANRVDAFDYHLRSFADCMGGGNRKDHDCRELKVYLENDVNPVIEIIYFTLVAFLNFASLPFVIQFRTVKHRVRRATLKRPLMHK